jgi:hypothetical protein
MGGEHVTDAYCPEFVAQWIGRAGASGPLIDRVAP